MGTSGVADDRLHPTEIRFAEVGRSRTSSEPSVAVFHIANLGTEELVATVRTTCSCILLSGSELRLAPGQRETLRFQVIRPTVGTREASIVLATNEPSAPERRLKVVVPGLNAIPFVVPAGLDKVSFLNVTRSGHVRTVAIRTVEQSDADPWIGSWITSADYVSAKLTDLSASSIDADGRIVNRTYKFDLLLTDLPARGTHSSVITLMERRGTEEVTRIPFVVQHVAPFVAVPSALFLDAARLVRLKVIETETGARLAIRRASADRPWIACRVVGDDEQSAVEITVADYGDTEPAKGHLLIEPDTPSEETLSVPVALDRTMGFNSGN